ncbi:hypothetical protein AVEN_89589-1 [Araneus ventricosus]|uniref:Uncharacterized protein n=1 Tax=Araneus ventricosus TaxID=182803 RepID=A0A4Y2ILS8_ARAVE|nr:hypothetical protein AVEN_89589-1 [Araneus ventricosus]
MPRECKNNPDSFCYVCGDLTLKAQRKLLSPLLQTAYHFYFDCQVGDQGKEWPPKLCCTTCYSSLTKWLKGTCKSMPFAVSMPETDLEDFEPQPGPSTSTDDDEEYPADLVHRQPHLVIQSESNYLVRDLELPKSESQFLGSRLQQWNLLKKGVKISSYRTRQSTLKLLLSEDEGLVFCPNSNELMIELKIPCDPHKWRLFIDSSKTSLKVVLLANGNDLPLVPVAYSVDMKETYENIYRILDKICYHDYN